MYAVAFICLLVGLCLSPGTISVEVRALLITLFGLLSAGLLPALALLVSTPIPPAYSVARATDMSDQLDNLTKGLIITLGFIVFGALSVLTLAFGLPQFTVGFSPEWLGTLLGELPERVTQALVLVFLVLSLDRLRLFVMTFRAVGTLRREIALEEARSRIESRAPSEDDIRKIFKTSPNHGKSVPVSLKRDD